jgi:hypothetical protein
VRVAAVGPIDGRSGRGPRLDGIGRERCRDHAISASPRSWKCDPQPAFPLRGKRLGGGRPGHIIHGRAHREAP